MDRLYIVIDGTLPPGDQIAQTGHAASQFAFEHTELHHQWFASAKNIVVVSASSEHHLHALLALLKLGKIPYSAVHEPDLRNQLTAFATTGAARRYLSSLPLALRPQRRPRADQSMPAIDTTAKAVTA